MQFTLPAAGQYTIGVFRMGLVEPAAVEPTVFQLRITTAGPSGHPGGSGCWSERQVGHIAEFFVPKPPLLRSLSVPTPGTHWAPL